MPDQLTRQPFLDLLKSVIANQTMNKTGYSIAIDGEWGCGKTWVVNELENQLNNQQDSNQRKKYLVFHYNAWENDFYDEPLVALLSILIDQLEEKNKCTNLLSKLDAKTIAGAKSVLKIVAKSIIKNKSGIDADDIMDGIKNIKEAAEKNKKIKKETNTLLPLTDGVKKIKEQITTLSKRIPVILVIDELDRCLPEYAIKVLERLHHICNETPIITIMAIEKNQIADSICKVFGKNLNDAQKKDFANHYLQKFIDITIPLNKGKIQDNDLSVFNEFEKQFKPYRNLCDTHFLSDFYQNIMSVFPKRTQKKILQTVELAHTLTIQQGSDLEYYSYQLLCIELLYGIRKCVFNNDFEYECKNQYNTDEFSLKLNVISQDILCKQYQDKLNEYSKCRATCQTSQNKKCYLNVETTKQLLLNYFLPNLSYTAADGYTHYVEDIQKDKAFLDVFIKTLDFTETNNS